MLQHLRKAHIEIWVTNVKVKVIMTYKVTIIYSAIAITTHTLHGLITSHWNGRRKQGGMIWILGRKVKGQPSWEVWFTLSFWRDILRHIDHCYYLLCTHFQDDERKTPRKFESRSGKNAVRKRLVTLNIFAYCVRYDALWDRLSSTFGDLSLFMDIFSQRNRLFLLHNIRNSRNLAGRENVRIGLPKFRFTEQDSNLTFIFKNTIQNFYKIQNWLLFAFYRIIQYII